MIDPQKAVAPRTVNAVRHFAKPRDALRGLVNIAERQGIEYCRETGGGNFTVVGNDR